MFECVQNYWIINFLLKFVRTFWSMEPAPYAKLTVTINCEQPTILYKRVDEVNFVSNPTDTASFFAGNFELVIRISDNGRYDLYLTFLFLVVYKLNHLGCALFCLCNGSTIPREAGDEQFTTWTYECQEPMSRSLQLPYQACVMAFLQTDLFLVHLFFCERKAVPVQWRSDVN